MRFGISRIRTVRRGPSMSRFAPLANPGRPAVPAASIGTAKVFCVGFHKTGTSSLGRALEVLGYTVCGEVGVREARIGEIALDLAKQKLPHYDAFQDNPWPILFRELDTACPNSRFILTSRETERWLASITRHFGEHDTPMRAWIYGVGHPAGHEERYRARYEGHNRAVREYFAERPGDLLEMNFEAGDGWEKLCPFLERSIPETPLPHLNRERSLEADLDARGSNGPLARVLRLGRAALDKLPRR